jgi:hypothetical protein
MVQQETDIQRNRGRGRERERERVYQERCFPTNRSIKVKNQAMNEMESKHNRMNEVDSKRNRATEEAGLKVNTQARSSTEVKHPLLRACSTSAALMAAGKHTHVRTHRTCSDPIYLHTYVYLYMKREEGEGYYFRTPGLKRTFG